MKPTRGTKLHYPCHWQLTETSAGIWQPQQVDVTTEIQQQTLANLAQTQQKSIGYINSPASRKIQKSKATGNIIMVVIGIIAAIAFIGLKLLRNIYGG